MSGEPAWTTCARCHSPIRPGGTCPVCTPYKADIADLQAENARLRELLAQCREMVLNGVQVAERAYHCWATEGGPLEYDPNDECCTPLRQYGRELLAAIDAAQRKEK